MLKKDKRQIKSAVKRLEKQRGTVTRRRQYNKAGVNGKKMSIGLVLIVTRKKNMMNLKKLMVSIF